VLFGRAGVHCMVSLGLGIWQWAGWCSVVLGTEFGFLVWSEKHPSYGSGLG